MKIDTDPKFDFQDVMLVPKISQLNSRNEVTLERTFIFKNSKQTWTGIPIVCSTMDSVGTVKMARALQKFKMITCLHKYHKYTDIPEDLDPEYFAVSSGISDADLENLSEIVKNRNIKFICIDVANGYTPNFLSVVRKMRDLYPNKVLIAGNVVTANMTESLLINGLVDIVKVGIGSGSCFAGYSKVLMGDGNYKNISDLQIGDFVMNKNKFPVKVLNVFNQGYKPTLEITTSNWEGSTIVTEDHLYLTSDGEWKAIGEIEINSGMASSVLLSRKKSDVAVTEVWDIEVDCPTHSFIVNNSVVHNCCTTRIKTGVGYPQFSAVVECADAAHGLDGHIMSDGGIQHIGDFGKCFAAGGDFVMCGSIFAGHEECQGEIIEIDGQLYKSFYGMSSAEAMNKYHGGVASYRSAEGKSVKVKYKGKVEETVQDILGGIRSTMTYISAKSIKNIPKCASFIVVHRQVNTIYGSGSGGNS